MYAVHEEDVHATVLPGRDVLQLLTTDWGCESIRMGVSIFSPNAHAPGHVHDSEEEAIYILEGSGRMHVGDRVEEVRPGTAVYVPPGVEHSVENTGAKPIKLVYAFSPPAAIGAYPDVAHE